MRRLCRLYRRAVPYALVFGVVGVLAWLPPIQQAQASNDMRALFQTAVTNDNRAHTFVQARRAVVAVPSAHRVLQYTQTTQYDEVHNQQSNQANFAVTSHTTTGTRTVRYSVDVIFANGNMYYRSSLDKNQWHLRKGATEYIDPLSRVHWKRGRYVLYTLSKRPFQVITSSPNVAHVRVDDSNGYYKGMVDVWVVRGATPYVIREYDRGNGVEEGLRVQVQFHDHFTSFNRPLHIQIPKV